MRFFIHGALPPEVPAALAKKEHACHTLPGLPAAVAPPTASAGGEAGLVRPEASAPPAAPAPAPAEQDPAVLLPLLDKKQWHLLTADAALVRGVYEKKIPFGGAIVLLLDDPGAAPGQGRAIERLFERYPRLTPGRLYTVTPSRVKIRQLPGAGAHRG